VRGRIVLCITEVEAYVWPDDSASHCRFGRTARNAPMWGPAGHAYVYLCYGIHSMLNIVTNAEGEGAAVLIRACEPVSGLAAIRGRRGGRSGPDALTGPGKVAAALGLDPSWSGHPLFRKGGLTLHEGEPCDSIVKGPRIGIEYAKPEHKSAPWRFAAADSEWVTHRRALS
jgi:DNA-3-methyladenine glycosylase